MKPASTRLSRTTLARARRRQIDMRRESRRRLEQAGEHRCFSEVYVARGLVEIELCRRIHAEGAAAEIGAVEIEFEDLVLRQPYFEPQREERFLDFALDGALVRQEQVLGQLLADGGTALHHAAGAGIREHRAEQAGNVDAEVFVETAVLGGERRLDQVIGELVERDCVVVPDAARADFIAVAIEEGDGELGFLQPIVVGSFTEGGDRERQQDQQAAAAQGETLRQRFDEAPTPPASDMEAVHEHGEALIKLAPPGLGLIHPEVDARVEIEQEAPQPYLPLQPVVVLEEVAQRDSLRAEAPRRQDAAAQPLAQVLTDRGVPNYGEMVKR